jgi:hypothetical protein
MIAILKLLSPASAYLSDTLLSVSVSRIHAPPLGSKLRLRRAWESILWFSRSPQPYADLKASGKEPDRLGFNGAIKFAEGGVSEQSLGVRLCFWFFIPVEKPRTKSDLAPRKLGKGG